MSEKILSTTEVHDQVDSWQREEILFLTSDRVIVAKTGWGLARKFGETGVGVLFASVMLTAIMVTVFVSSALPGPETGVTLYLVVSPFVSSLIAFFLYFIIHVIQSRKKKGEYVGLSPEEILNVDKDNFAITDSEVSKGELWEDWHVRYRETPWERVRSQPVLRIMLSKRVHKHKEYKWNLPKGEHWGTSYLSHYENLLRPFFGDKLSVKKSGRFLN